VWAKFSSIKLSKCSPSTPSYPDFESIQQQPVPTLIKEEAYQQPVTNVTEKAFSGFEETFHSDIEHTCARNQDKTDISAELVLSNDEESPSSQKEAKREADDKSSKDESNLKAEERDRTLKEEISVRERETSPFLKPEWSPENRS
ncbi:hypothetical protein AVEN_273379-1, partial [Araneus ventricosus]